uniref:Gamma-crystallin N-A-like n=1 Tax=Sinocyclocheilus grahami TaxID=75366 RepID=A0A672K5Z7_SINGR
MNIFTKVPGLAKQTSKLGSVLQRAFYGSSGRVTLFEQRNFAGRRLDLTSDCQKLSEKNFPDRCNSVQVESGAWVAYEHENFRGRQYLWDMFDRGEYNCTDRWCAQGDHISSVHAVKQVRHSIMIKILKTIQLASVFTISTGSTETCNGMIQNHKCKNCLFACVSWSRTTTLPVHSCLRGQVFRERRQSSMMTSPT